MADLSTNLDVIMTSQASKEVTANALFDAVSPASLFGRRAAGCIALTWAYYGGVILSGGTPTTISNGTVALTASATNYVEATTAGVVSANTTGFTAGRTPLYTVVTNSSGVTDYTDKRVGLNGGVSVTIPKVFIAAISDETTALAAGTAKLTFRMPYAMTLSEIRASLTTAQVSGSIFTIDIKESGTSIFSTKLTIDNTEKTSKTAATPAVISDPSIADDAEITVDIFQIGDGTAKGCKITFIGT